MLRIKYGANYHQDYKKLLGKQPELTEEVNTRVEWFKKNPGDTRLNNHNLKKKMKGQWAFSITGDIRIVYRWIGKNEVRFLAIGGHKKVYGEIG